MSSRKRWQLSMSEIAAAVRVEKEQEVRPTDETGPRQQLIDGRVFTVSDDEITPERAADIAAEARLVIWDWCGCGGGCGYRFWEGRAVRDLLAAGLPDLGVNGMLWELHDEDGHRAVLAEQGVRWGPLR